MQGRAARLRPELVGLLTLFILAGLILAFGLLAQEVLEGDTSAFDRRILLLFRDPSNLSHVIGPAWLPEMMRDLTSLGSTVVLGLVVLIVAGYLALARMPAALALVLGSVLGGQAISTVLKVFFERARPDLIPGAPQVFTASFPSGHAMLSAVTYLTLGALLTRIEEKRSLKRYFMVVAVALTMVVGASRVFLGVHWPTDVLGGWCVGAAWAMICSSVARRLQRRGKLERLN